MAEYLFDDNFSVSRLDPDGKKFDKGNLPLVFFTVYNLEFHWTISAASNRTVQIFLAFKYGLICCFFFPCAWTVTRIEAHNEQMYMQLDIATEIYPMHAGDKFNMVLAPTLNIDGTPDTGYYTQVMQLT